MRYYSQANNRAKILFWLYILVEITLFILVGKLIGVFATLALIFLTTIVGVVLLQNQKAELMKQFQMSTQAKKPHNFNLFTSSFVMLAGILLMMPGFFTDFLGVLCLIPKLRVMILKIFGKSRIVKTKKPAANDSNTIDGECWHEDGEDDKKR